MNVVPGRQEASVNPLWKDKPWRSEKYRRWIKRKPCCNCRMPADDPHHEGLPGHGGVGTTPGDDRAVPLCRVCHDIRQHGPLGRAIWQKWGRDPEVTIRRLNAEWVALGNSFS